MSLLSGFGDWSREYAKHAAYLLDRHLYALLEDGASLTRSGGAGVVVGLDGRAMVQGFFRAAEASLRSNRLAQSPPLVVAEQEDYTTILRAMAVPAGVSWCPYFWDLESFDVVDGSTYSLTRPHAAGIVPGVTSGSHPVLVYLDGVEDGTAATVDGLTVTAAATGRVSIYYMPVYSVLVVSVSEAIPEYPVLAVTLGLEEVG